MIMFYHENKIYSKLSCKWVLANVGELVYMTSHLCRLLRSFQDNTWIFTWCFRIFFITEYSSNSVQFNILTWLIFCANFYAGHWECNGKDMVVSIPELKQSREDRLEPARQPGQPGPWTHQMIHSEWTMQSVFTFLPLILLKGLYTYTSEPQNPFLCDYYLYAEFQEPVHKFK